MWHHSLETNRLDPAWRLDVAKTPFPHFQTLLQVKTVGWSGASINARCRSQTKKLNGFLKTFENIPDFLDIFLIFSKHFETLLQAKTVGWSGASINARCRSPPRGPNTGVAFFCRLLHHPPRGGQGGRGGPGGSYWLGDLTPVGLELQPGSKIQTAPQSSSPWQGCHWLVDTWTTGGSSSTGSWSSSSSSPSLLRRGCEGWDEANAGTTGRLLFMADRRDNLGPVKKLSQKLSSQFISTRASQLAPAGRRRNQGYSSPTELPLLQLWNL